MGTDYFCRNCANRIGMPIWVSENDARRHFEANPHHELVSELGVTMSPDRRAVNFQKSYFKKPMDFRQKKKRNWKSWILISVVCVALVGLTIGVFTKFNTKVDHIYGGIEK